MSEEEIILKCPGGKCPIKISCATHDPEAKENLLPIAPFSQFGREIRCRYLKLKDVTTPNTTTQTNAAEEKVLPDTQEIRNEGRPMEDLSGEQGSLFT